MPANIADFLGILLCDRLQCYFTMWFVPALFSTEVALFLLRKILRKWPLLLVVGGLLLQWPLSYLGRSLPWSLDLLPIMICFVSLGYVLRFHKKKMENLFRWRWLPLACVLSVVFAYLNHRVCGKVDLFCRVLGNYVFMIIGAISGSWGVLICSKKMKRFPPLEYIGRNSLVYYAVHASLLLPVSEATAALLVEEGTFLWQYARLMIIVPMVCVGCAIWSQCMNKGFPILLGKRYAQK